jgi:tetratricopeptide (TPR) repeat protein
MGARRYALVALAVTALGSLPACDALRAHIALRNANHLYKAGKYEEAIAEYRKIIAVRPDDWQANYLIAVSYLALYHPDSTHPKDREYADRALAGFETLLRLRSPTPQEGEKVRRYYLSLLMAAERFDRAVTYLESRLAADPRDTRLMSELGRLYGKLGDFPASLRYYRMRTRSEPDSKEAWYTVGVVCWERSYRGAATISNDERATVVDKGLEAERRALEIDPGYVDALAYTNLLYREKAKVLETRGKLAEARAAWRTADRFLARALEARHKGEDHAPAPSGG